MTAIQVIQFTRHTVEWHMIAETLGLTVHGEKNDVWAEFDGDGMLAVHGVDDGDPLAGTAEIWMLVEDDATLDGLASRLAAAGIAAARGEMDGIGQTLDVVVDPRATVHVVVGTAREPHGDVSLQPLIFSADVEAASRVMAELGLMPSITSDSGGWGVYTAPGGGSIALHAADTATTNIDDARIGLSFEHRGDLDALAERLTARGVESTVVDEAYNRTLRAVTPEGPELWVNGAQTDFYGYSVTTEQSVP